MLRHHRNDKSNKAFQGQTCNSIKNVLEKHVSVKWKPNSSSRVKFSSARSRAAGNPSQLDWMEMSIVSCLWILNVRLLQRHSSSYLQRGRWSAIWELIVRGRLCTRWERSEENIMRDEASFREQCWQPVSSPSEGWRRRLDLNAAVKSLKSEDAPLNWCLVWKLSLSNYPWLSCFYTVLTFNCQKQQQLKADEQKMSCTFFADSENKTPLLPMIPTG